MDTSLAEKSTLRERGSMLRLLVVLVLAACMHGWSPIASALDQVLLPDFSGSWSGGDWGEVVLERIGPVSYAGTYSSTHRKDVGRVTFSFVAGKYEGKWWEGAFRLGTITLESSEDGRILTGNYSGSPASIIKPGEPKSASFKWTKK